MKKRRWTLAEALRRYELGGPAKLERAALNVIRDAAVAASPARTGKNSSGHTDVCRRADEKPAPLSSTLGDPQ
jgi:hypothetical protein